MLAKPSLPPPPPETSWDSPPSSPRPSLRPAGALDAPTVAALLELDATDALDITLAEATLRAVANARSEAWTEFEERAAQRNTARVRIGAVRERALALEDGGATHELDGPAEHSLANGDNEFEAEFARRAPRSKRARDGRFFFTRSEEAAMGRDSDTYLCKRARIFYDENGARYGRARANALWESVYG